MSWYTRINKRTQIYIFIYIIFSVTPTYSIFMICNKVRQISLIVEGLTPYYAPLYFRSNNYASLIFNTYIFLLSCVVFIYFIFIFPVIHLVLDGYYKLSGWFYLYNNSRKDVNSWWLMLLELGWKILTARRLEKYYRFFFYNFHSCNFVVKARIICKRCLYK